MKKLLLSVGTIGAIVAPVVAVVSCDAGEFGFSNNADTSLTEAQLISKVQEAKDNHMTIETLSAHFGMSGTILPTQAPKDQTINVNDILYDKDNKILTIKTSSIMTADGTTSTTEYSFKLTFSVVPKTV